MLNGTRVQTLLPRGMIILHEPEELEMKNLCSISDRNETFFFIITSDQHPAPPSLLPNEGADGSLRKGKPDGV
jgi:hypothetical protein